MQINSRKWYALIREGAEGLGIDIQQDQMAQCSLHALELLKWNRKFNLTAITDPFDVAIKHVVDSLAPVTLLRDTSSLVDIGSGGGFPGIPIKVLLPALHVTLVEPSRKKVNFLKHVIRTAGLENIDAVHARAEDLSRDDAFAGHFDTAVCRAFSSIDRFVDLAFPLIKKNGGTLIAMKGKKKDDLDFLRSREERDVSIQTTSYTLPFIQSERRLVAICVS